MVFTQNCCVFLERGIWEDLDYHGDAKFYFKHTHILKINKSEWKSTLSWSNLYVYFNKCHFIFSIICKEEHLVKKNP